jgi:hypothetical protein
MTKIGKKAAQDFFCAVSKVFDRVKTVSLNPQVMKKLSYNPILKGKSAPENRKQKYHIYLNIRYKP